MLITNGRNHGGTEAHVSQVGIGLVRRGFRVVALLSPREDIAWLGDELAAGGVEVRHIDERSRGLTAPLWRALKLRANLRDVRHGILHLQFNGHPSGELTMVAARLAGLKTIVRTDHNPPLPKLTRRERWSLKLRDRLLSKIIVISEQDRRWYQQRLHRDVTKMCVIPHGIDLDLYERPGNGRAQRTALGIPEASLVVGNVANLGESKGTRQFLEMAAILGRREPSLRFVVVGGGPLLDQYKSEAAALGVASRMVFAGQIERDCVPAFLGAMDIFVLPSLQESGPYTVLEAMSVGLPVVATRVGFVPELIHDGKNGMSVEPGDVAGLADAVQALLDDPERARAIAARAREHVRAERSSDAMIDQIVDVYRELGAMGPLPVPRGRR